MKSNYILALSATQADLALVGGKGASLSRLSAAGLPVPQGFHVMTVAYDQFVRDNNLWALIQTALASRDPDDVDALQAASQVICEAFAQAQMPEAVATAIRQAYASLPGESPAVAVRSSATAEDLPDLSFAGQQETYLNLSGAAAVLEAVQRCWASLWTARAIDYRDRHGIDHELVSLAVVVQLLVPAGAAGILFTANPVNGVRDQAMVSAAWGLGESIVSGQVNPDTLIVDKTTGRIMTRDTADKHVMTIRVEGGTETRPVPEKLRHAPVLSDQQAAELVHLGVLVEELFGLPMDIEWTLAEGQIALVQARPITALPEPQANPPTAWKLPKGKYVAMRNNIVELMAEPLSPLFATLGRASINTSMGRMIDSFIPGLVPEEVIITVNDYAYYNGSLTMRQFGKIMIHSVGIMKRMFTGVEERWRAARPPYISIVRTYQATPWREFTCTRVLAAVSEIMAAAIDYYGVLVGGIIPAAWISEGIFTAIYNLAIKRAKDPAAATFLLGFESAPILAEKSLYNLARWVRRDPELASYLREAPAIDLVAQLKIGPTPAGMRVEAWNEWRTRFQAHLARYGHTIYNLDFASPVPADNSEPVLETCQMFIRGLGTDPHTRQQAAAARREQATEMLLGRLKGARLALFRKSLTTAQRYAPFREDGLADIGLGYPLLRKMLLELGHRFTEGGTIASPDDIFWLNGEEVEHIAACLDRGEAPATFTAKIPTRKATWRAAGQVSPPLMLPEIKILGLNLAKFRQARTKGDVLAGVGASPGRVTATARVLRGPEDFDQMKAGDVLVASITTPAWTPLFARAAAIVTDVGGPLSHGSIVAREYGIPAVLGTGEATRQILSGQEITVDGGKGKVYLNRTALKVPSPG